MCMGGGNNAAAQAQQQVQQQQQTTNANVGAINSAFANRGQQYTDYLAALRQSYQTQLDKQQATASRQLKFAGARGGLTGGSEQAQLGGELQQEMGQGELSAEQTAQSKLAGLQSADQAERLQMISLAQGGASIGNAAQETATSLQANINNAQAGLSPTALGNTFGGIADTTNAMNAGASARLGLRAAQAYAMPWSQSSSTNSGFGGGNTN
jgi:hypothetical protein